MTISEEMLMAYADGELDPQARASIEAAMHDDPTVLQRVERHQQLRTRLKAAFAAELDEAVPPRLVALISHSHDLRYQQVTDLSAVRDHDSTRAPPVSRRRAASTSTLAMAASLLIGVGIGYAVFLRAPNTPVVVGAGGLLAGGVLATALSTQLSGDEVPNAGVSIGLTFSAKTGEYCRTFTLQGSHGGSIGLACRQGADWQINLLTASRDKAQPQGSDPVYRPATSVLPPVILSAIEAQISGDTLDRAGETKARRDDWQAH